MMFSSDAQAEGYAERNPDADMLKVMMLIKNCLFRRRAIY